MNQFTPDLIVEVTSACNRACPGCYAPNLVTKKSHKEAYEENPGQFLKILDLNNAFHNLTSTSILTTVRGGEPTLHPKLPIMLVMIKRHSIEVMIETHGRWIYEEPENFKELLSTIAEEKIIVKVSFDKMHRLDPQALKSITTKLEELGVDYRVAITEPGLIEMLETRKLCNWVVDEKIIFQIKAVRADQLVKPYMGVIDVNGAFKSSLNSKEELNIFEAVDF